MATINSDVILALNAAFPALALGGPLTIALWTFLRGGMITEEAFDNREKLILETLVERLCECQKDLISWTVAYAYRAVVPVHLDVPPPSATKFAQEIARMIHSIARVSAIGRALRTLHSLFYTNAIIVVLIILAALVFESIKPIASIVIAAAVIIQTVLVSKARGLAVNLSAEHGRS